MTAPALPFFSGVPPLLGATVFAVSFWAVVLALGHRVLRLAQAAPCFTPAERGLLSLAVGAGLLPLLPCGLALVGWMTPPVLRWAFLALAVLLAPELVRLARGVGRALAGRPWRALPRWAVAWGVLFALLMGMLLVRAAVLDHFGDDDGYHLSAPKRWLQAGTLAYLPSYMTTNSTMGFEMLYAMALSLWGPAGAKLLHFSAGLFLFLGIWLTGRRFADGLAGLTVVSVLLVPTPFIDLPFLFERAYVDLPAAWMAITAVLVWMVWRTRREPRLLTCLALVAGFAGSFKATAIAGVVAWVPVLALEARREGHPWPRVAAGLTRFGLCAALPILPWFLRNWRLTGNPFYPLLAGLIPTRDWTLEHARNFSRYMHYYAWGVGAGPGLGELQRKELVVAAALVTVLLGAVALLRLRQPLARGLALLATTFTLLTVGQAGLVFRYWLPAFAVALLIASSLLVGRLATLRRTGLALGAIALALLMRLEFAVRDTRFPAHLRLVLGLSPPEEVFAQDWAWNFWRHINASTPPDARILMGAFYLTVGASNFGAFSVERTCFATDSHQQSYIRLDDWPTFLASVRAAGIDHVVVADKPSCAGRIGFSFPAADHEFTFSRRLADELGEAVGPHFADFRLYRLRWPERDSQARR